ncbi:MAG: hypothetical protein K1060chlam3_00700 [Candidatus Anoxychlamydiales bacterium]|nr:hypothetical protein [Candidatus Anoxychlamydiales bacterium]
MSILGCVYDKTIQPLVNSAKSGFSKASTYTGLSTTNRKIFAQRSQVIVTLQGGFRFLPEGELNSLGPHLGKFPNYIDLKNYLDTAISGGTVTSRDGLSVKLTANPALGKTPKATEIYTKYKFIRDETRDATTFYKYIDIVDDHIKIIEEELKLPPADRKQYYELLDVRIGLIKINLEEAANELGKRASVYPSNDSILKECIAEFNDTFLQGYNLNQEVERKKNKDISLGGLKTLLNVAKSSSKPLVDMWDRPIMGRAISLGTSYTITHVAIPFILGGLDGLNLSMPIISLAALASQPAVTLYIDEALRFIRWKSKQTPIDIFNFNNAENNILRFGDINSSSPKSALDKDLQSEALTRKVAETKGEIETNKTRLEKLIKLYANLQKLEEMSQHKNRKFIYDLPKDFIKEINEVFEDYIIDGVRDLTGKTTYLNNGKDFELATFKDLRTGRMLLSILNKIITPLSATIKDQERSIRNALHGNRKFGIAPIEPATSRRARTRKETSVKSTFADYESSDKKKFFHNLSTALIKNNKFEKLDLETELFLIQLCSHYKERTEGSFEKAIKTLELKSAGMGEPTKAFMDALKYKAAEYRTN